MTKQAEPVRVEKRLLDVERLSRGFPAPDGSVIRALDNVSFRVNRGDFIGIVGHNGSGKSTLLNLLRGILPATSGTVTFYSDAKQRSWLELSRRDRAQLIGYLRQDPDRNTFQSLTVFENFWISACRDSPMLSRFRPQAGLREAVQTRLEQIGLAQKLDARVEELSQGQRQLLALEIELLAARKPLFFFLDEHTASLDRKNAFQCMEATARLNREEGMTVLLVTHNLADAIRYCSRVLVLRDGRLVADLSGADKDRLTLQRLMEISGMGVEARQ